jgi:hypothetical protein
MPSLLTCPTGWQVRLMSEERVMPKPKKSFFHKFPHF